MLDLGVSNRYSLPNHEIHLVQVMERTMESLNLLFRKRISFREKGALTFDDLPELLHRTAFALPFENLAVIEGRGQPISRENLVEKMLVRNEGGLCYELNPLLYFFLLENGFEVSMVRGIVFSAETRSFVGTGQTHVTLILRHQGMPYVIDTGFGGFIPLCPVPMNAEVVESSNGEFRITSAIEENAAHGNFVFELKQRYKDDDWRVGYVFDSKHPITTAECDEIRHIIAEHPASPFNQRPLVTRRNERGSITLTDKSLIIMRDGNVYKEPVKPERFPGLLPQHFGFVEYAKQRRVG